jgi:plastocyanin
VAKHPGSAAKQPGSGAKQPGSGTKQPGSGTTQAQAVRRRHARLALNSAATGSLAATLGRATVRAHVAGDPGDVISDFKFAPATITVHVGDSITWTNDGPSPHSATANNGSFDNGVLKKGQSASHTFSQAGTFTYFCSVHPFMHGTVVVVADTSSSGSGSGQGSGSTSGGSGGSSGGSGGSSGGSGGSSGGGGSTGSTASSSQTTTPAATSGQPTLPLTGTDSVRTVLAGLVLAAIGLSIRRRLRARR